VIPPFAEALGHAFAGAGGRPLAQAATVSPAGLPEVRTVVLRGLGPEADAWFASDARSHKFRSLTTTPWLELCLFDAAAGVQWRLRGRVSLHKDDALARRAWSELPPTTRQGFFSPPPGAPVARTAGDASAPVAGLWRAAGADRGEAPAIRPAEPPATFAVVRLPPARCDRLVLGPPLLRRRWTLEGGAWKREDLVP